MLPPIEESIAEYLYLERMIFSIPCAPHEIDLPFQMPRHPERLFDANGRKMLEEGVIILPKRRRERISIRGLTFFIDKIPDAREVSSEVLGIIYTPHCIGGYILRASFLGCTYNLPWNIEDRLYHPLKQLIAEIEGVPEHKRITPLCEATQSVWREYKQEQQQVAGFSSLFRQEDNTQ